MLPNRFTRNHDRVKSFALNKLHGMFAVDNNDGGTLDTSAAPPKKKLVWEIEKPKRSSVPDIITSSQSQAKPIGITDRYKDYLHDMKRSKVTIESPLH
jgi:hypothetical protein